MKKAKTENEPRAFAAELATWTLAQAGQFIFQAALKRRDRAAWARINTTARALNRLNCEDCETPTTPEREDRRRRCLLNADRHVRAAFGADAVCYFQHDPRGLPLFISWPGMPDTFRDAFEPERGMGWTLDA